ncbi:hypothetical protein [Parapedobacter koreensis]|uniref:ATP-dependent DNA helicase RecG n=1 Tax=Parapedobacter koreensis TaxID=332977 RepID=A0A1H7GUF3_9SPHI|nr:hypothetical protein [Parapedobacter koreensis]SEK41708.1 ATP-dependent DNA helicase RecG [Parapedobacter koreensis]
MQVGRTNIRRYRKRQIDNILKELKLTEGKCTGIPKALKEMKRNGSPAPLFYTDEYRTTMWGTLPIHELFLKEVDGNGLAEMSAGITSKQLNVYDKLIKKHPDGIVPVFGASVIG